MGIVRVRRGSTRRSVSKQPRRRGVLVHVGWSDVKYDNSPELMEFVSGLRSEGKQVLAVFKEDNEGRWDWEYALRMYGNPASGEWEDGIHISRESFNSGDYRIVWRWR